MGGVVEVLEEEVLGVLGWCRTEAMGCRGRWGRE